ncbi:MAG: hypothetical protein ACRD6B_06845 [Bryobacteraceae bacterium]
MKRCFLILVALLISGVLANAQCYADCSMAAVSASPMGPMTCCQGHSASLSQPGGACSHHQSRLFSPENSGNLAETAKGTFLPFSAAFAVPHLTSFGPAQERWLKPDPAPPPGQRLFSSLSVLRI